MLKFGSEEAFEIVLDDKDAEEIWISASAKDVPGKGGEAKGGDGGWMEEAKCVTPAFCEQCPEEDCPAAENDCGGALCENS